MYRVDITKVAKRDLHALDFSVLNVIDHAILSLEEEPHPPASRQLKGFYGYRLRVGDYRIIYTIDHTHKVVTVYRVRHRREVYRGY